LLIEEEYPEAWAKAFGEVMDDQITGYQKERKLAIISYFWLKLFIILLEKEKNKYCSKWIITRCRKTRLQC